MCSSLLHNFVLTARDLAFFPVLAFNALICSFAHCYFYPKCAKREGIWKLNIMEREMEKYSNLDLFLPSNKETKYLFKKKKTFPPHQEFFHDLFPMVLDPVIESGDKGTTNDGKVKTDPMKSGILPHIRSGFQLSEPETILCI